MCSCNTVMLANSLGVLFLWMYMKGKIGFLFVPYVGAISLFKVELSVALFAYYGMSLS